MIALIFTTSLLLAATQGDSQGQGAAGGVTAAP